MGKKKRGHPDIEEVLARPWCYYCERDFDDLKILISHQKAKHYKCDRCGRRLNTAGGLSVHMNQVHKENLTTVENALPNRSAPDIEIFGMEGIPDDVMQQHNQRVSHEFFAAEADRRAATGNPVPGSSIQGAAGTKKPKLESPAELKARLAEHKARKAAEKSGLGSAPDTPADVATPPQYQSSFPPPSAPQAASPPPATYPPQSYGQAPAGYGQQPPPFNYGESPYGAPPGPFPPGQFGSQPSYSPSQPYGGQGPPAPFVPPAQYAYPPHSASPPQYQNSRHAPPMSPPAQELPTRQNSLPSAPGLPQRPTFNAPHVSREQLAEMHSGNMGGPVAPPQESGANATSVDELISGVAAQHSAKSAPSQQPTSTPAPEKEAESAGKKSKKATRLVYSDQEVSPEEKMAQMPRYAFTPDKGGETYLAPVEANVTGIVRGPDDVIDAQG
ncbi:hypothetical protein E4T48_02832 [Aureobasidium sp. EXF-10727]|nr:hypothetical protein E4T48_02832 [Aureobasidium sp. EXF-10727]